MLVNGKNSKTAALLLLRAHFWIRPFRWRWLAWIFVTLVFAPQGLYMISNVLLLHTLNMNSFSTFSTFVGEKKRREEAGEDGRKKKKYRMVEASIHG